MAQVSLSPAPLAPSLARSASPSFRLRSSSLNSVRLRRVFDLFDRNGDGEITVAELSLALDRLGLGAEPGELASAVAAFIRPGRSGLAYEDFEAFHGALGEALFGDLGGEGEGEEEGKAEEEEDMREAFKVFDEDGDGFISARELQAVLEKLGMAEGRSADRVRQMICSVDRDSDGRVDFGEFKQMMRNVQVDGA